MDAAARALAQPTRREILRLVHDRELTANEIAGHFPVSRPAISQHLRALQDADLVVVRQEGTRRWYTSRPEGLAELHSFLNDFWTDHLAALKTQAEWSADRPDAPRSK